MSFDGYRPITPDVLKHLKGTLYSILTAINGIEGASHGDDAAVVARAALTVFVAQSIRHYVTERGLDPTKLDRTFAKAGWDNCGIREVGYGAFIVTEQTNKVDHGC